MSAPLWKPPARIVRRPGWEMALSDTLAAELARPFAWGIDDCLTQQAAICAAMTGKQVFPKRMRTYRTAKGAQKLLLKLGFTTIEQALDAVFERTAPALARRGDCGLARLADGTLAALTVMGTHAVGRNESGRVLYPTLSLVAAFAVG